MALALPDEAANSDLAHATAATSKTGIFALQHLRVAGNWLNSMQPGAVAYFVCRKVKCLRLLHLSVISRSQSARSCCRHRRFWRRCSGVTDAPFRRLAARLGAGLVVSE